MWHSRIGAVGGAFRRGCAPLILIVWEVGVHVQGQIDLDSMLLCYGGGLLPAGLKLIFEG